jgi:hypothetical protein
VPGSGVVLNAAAPAAFTVTVSTSGKAIVGRKISPRRLPHTPALPGGFAVALGTLLVILVLRLYSDWSGLIPTVGPHASRWKIAYARAALLIFVPLLIAAGGCGGASTNTPAAQKSSIVTPSGTSTLVISANKPPTLQAKRCRCPSFS